MSQTDAPDYRSLGEVLRDARESRVWTIELVSEKTKISTRMLEAIEVDDLERVSGPVYAKGFVKTLGELYELDVAFLNAKLDALAAELGASVPVQPVDFPSQPETVEPELRRAQPESTKPVWEVETTRVRRVEMKKTLPVPSRNLMLVGASVLLVALLIVSWSAGWLSVERDRGIQPQRGAGTAHIADDEAEADPVISSPAESNIDDSSAPSEAVEELADEQEQIPGRQDSDPPQELVQELQEPAESPAVVVHTPEPLEDQAEANTPVDTANDTAAGEDDRGLPSVVRPTGAGRAALLRLTASSTIDVEVQVDAGASQSKRLEAGESWQLRGSDHFLLRTSDPSFLRIEVGGREQTPPSAWTGRVQWFVEAFPSGQR